MLTSLSVLPVIHTLFRHVFTGLEQRYAKELAVVRQQYPSAPVRFTEKPLVLHWKDGIKLLQDAGVEVGDSYPE